MPRRSEPPAVPASGPPLEVIRLTPYFYFSEAALTRWTIQFEPVGGMQVQIAHLTEALDRLGHAQRVVTTGMPGIRRDSLRWRQVRLNSVRVPFVSWPTRSKGLAGLLAAWGLGSVLWALREAARRPRTRYRLVHCHCSELPWTFVVGPTVAAILRLPLVLTVHCSAIETVQPDGWFEWVYFRLARVAERWALGRATTVVTLSERLRRAYVEAGLRRAEDTFVVPDGVDVGTLLAAARASEDRVRSRAKREPEVVLYCGRIAPEKGWRQFLQAAAILAADPCISFIVAGDGNERRALRSMVRELGLDDRVALAGFVHHDRVAGLIARASVVVIPSIHEELGGTVLEAMALERPVVASRVGGIPEVVGDGITGMLVEPGDAEAIARSVRALLDDPELATRIATAGGAAVRERFDMLTLAHRMEEIYQHALATART